MSAINLNMQDNVMKSAYVSQIQDRSVDVARADHQAQSAFHEELTRQANEVVENVQEADQEEINEKNEKEKQREGKKKRRRRNPEEGEEKQADGWTMGPDDDGKPHVINIIA